MLLEVQARMNENNIFPRRYFNPSLNTINYVRHAACPVSEDVASRILCLPLYIGLMENELVNISKYLKLL
jgi:dTDP-4-amino-4,6-dideoxygalactose transaminase